MEPGFEALKTNRVVSAEKSARTAELVFLLQVSRPGLWSTTALFYLMPLGRADFLHSRTLWLGLSYVLFPLGFLLYGVNDIVDAEADRWNPRKGTFLFGSLGAAEQLAALRWKIAAVQIPFLIIFFYLDGARILAWFAVLLIAVGLYNAPRFGWKSHPPLDVLIQASYLLVFVLSSWLNQVHQLPWQTFLFWRNVRDALSYFRRSDGYRSGPEERTTHDGDVDGRGAFQIADRSDFVCGDGAGLLLFPRFGDHRISWVCSGMVFVGRPADLEKSPVQPVRNATFYVGLERGRLPRNVLELVDRQLAPCQAGCGLVRIV